MGLISTLATAVAKKGVTAITKKITGTTAAKVAVGAGTIAAGTALGNVMSGGGWEDMGPARRRRKGLSGRDIEGAQRVMRLVSTFGYKPKLPCRRKGRKCR